MSNEKELLEALHRIESKVESLGGRIEKVEKKLEEPPPLAPKAVTKEQAAKVLGRSSKTVARMIARGELPTIAISGKEMVSVADLVTITTSKPKDIPGPLLLPRKRATPLSAAEADAEKIREAIRRRKRRG